MVLTCNSCQGVIKINERRESYIVECGHIYHNECLPRDDVCQTCHRTFEFPIRLKGLEPRNFENSRKVSDQELKQMGNQQKLINAKKLEKIQEQVQFIKLKKEKIKLFRDFKSINQ